MKQVSNRSFVLFVILFGLFMYVAGTVGNTGSVESADKVCVRHKDDGVPDKVIEIAASAVDAHVRKHGDVVVPCSTEQVVTVTATQVPVEQTPAPTSTPTAQPIVETPAPTSTPTAQPIVETPAPVETSQATRANRQVRLPVVPVDCGPGEACDACSFLMQALAEGFAEGFAEGTVIIIIIAHEGDVTIIGDDVNPQVQVSGYTLATGNLDGTR